MQMASNEISNHQLTRLSRPIMGSHNRTSTWKLALSPNIEIKFRAEKKKYVGSFCAISLSEHDLYLGRHITIESHMLVDTSLLFRAWFDGGHSWYWSRSQDSVSGLITFCTSCRYRPARAQHVIQQVLWSPRYNRKKEIYLGIMRTRWLTHLSGLVLPDCCEI